MSLWDKEWPWTIDRRTGIWRGDDDDDVGGNEVRSYARLRLLAKFQIPQNTVCRNEHEVGAHKGFRVF